MEQSNLYLNEKYASEGIWATAQPENLEFENPEIPKLNKEIERIEKEISHYEIRINQEIALTEKITENIKSRASNPRDPNVLRDIELQWRTTYANIENIKKMMQPKNERLQDLKKKLAEEKLNILKNLKNDYLDKIASEANTLGEGLDFLYNSIANLATHFQTLKLIYNELNISIDSESLLPTPRDSFEVFYESYKAALEQIHQFISKQS